MQSKPDLSSRTIQAFIGYKENTMNSALCANVGFILLGLAKHFSENSLDNAINCGESTISTEQVDKYIHRLSEYITEQNKAKHSGWQYIQKELAGKVNKLDRVTIWENGQEISRCIELKPTLALVYAALTDKEAFFKKALANKGFTTQKERITFRGEFEASYPQDEADRLLTLLNCFSDLEFKRVCHTGIRNDLVMTLNGVYPDVWIIEDIDRFLLDEITAYLHQQIDKFKSQPEQYRDIVLAKMDSELLEPLNEALEQSRLEFMDSIKISCAEHGINSQNLSIKIQDYLKNMQYLTLIWQDNVVFSALSAVMSLIPKAKDELLQMVQSWIKVHFQLNNEQHEKRVISFAQVRKTLDLFKKYQGLLKVWDQTSITKEEIEQLGSQLNVYEAACLEYSSPQQVSGDLTHEMQSFEKACIAFTKDAQCVWIENFFIQWAMAKRHNNNATLIQLYSHLHTPEMQIKYEVNDAFLEKHLPLDVTELDLTPYLINRVFLHAITRHPKSWSKSFFDRFSITYTFVAKELAKEELGHVANALKKDSYPEVLMQQLKYLQEYYQYFREDNWNETRSLDFHIPMKQFIFTVNQLSSVMEHLSETQKIAFIEALDNDFLKGLIKRNCDFLSVFKVLSDKQKIAFIETWDNAFFNTIFANSADFCRVIRRLSETQLSVFMKVLDNQILKDIIRNAHDFRKVTKRLLDTKKTEFIDTLDNTFFETIIFNTDGLLEVIRCLSDKQQATYMEAWGNILKSSIRDHNELCKVILSLSIIEIPVFIKVSGNAFLTSIIKNGGYLDDMYLNLLARNSTTFIEALDNDVLKSIVNSGNELKQVIRCLSDTRKVNFIEILSDDFLKSTVNDSDGLIQVIYYLSETRKTTFIETLDMDFVKRIIKTYGGLFEVIKHIPLMQRSFFMDMLDNEFLASIIKHVDHWHKVVEYLSEIRRTTFIESLGYVYLRSMVEESWELKVVLKYITETQLVAFVKGWDKEVLQSIIISPNCLVDVIKSLSGTRKTTFIETLGYDFLIAMIQNDSELRSMIHCLPEAQFLVFIKSWDNNFLKSIIKNSGNLGRVIQYLSETRQIAFMGTLDNQFLKSIIISPRNLADVTQHLFETPKIASIDALGNQFLKSLVSNSYELLEITRLLSKTQKIAFIKGWDNKSIKSFIRDSHELGTVIYCLPKAQIPIFIKSWDNDALKSIIKGGYELYQVTQHLSVTQKIAFVEALSNEFLQSIITNHNECYRVIMCLSEIQLSAFIKSWDKDFLKFIIKDSRELREMIRSLPETQLSVFIKSWDNDSLKSLIKNSQELLEIIRDLSVTRKIAFTEALDNAFLKTVIKDIHVLDSVLCNLPKIKQAAFKKAWDIVSHEEITVILDSYLEEMANEISTSETVKHYFYSFFFFSQNSFTQTKEAVNALKSALNGENIENLSQYLPILNNGKLGNILQHIIEKRNVVLLVGKEVNSVSDFIQALEDNLSNRDQNEVTSTLFWVGKA